MTNIFKHSKLSPNLQTRTLGLFAPFAFLVFLLPKSQVQADASSRTQYAGGIISLGGYLGVLTGYQLTDAIDLEFEYGELRASARREGQIGIVRGKVKWGSLYIGAGIGDARREYTGDLEESVGGLTPAAGKVHRRGGERAVGVDACLGFENDSQQSGFFLAFEPFGLFTPIKTLQYSTLEADGQPSEGDQNMIDEKAKRPMQAVLRAIVGKIGLRW